LSWPASADDVAVTGYEVWRSGVLIGRPTGPTYIDAATKEGQSYSYTVYAADAAGNRSTASASTTVLVPDRIPPTAPTSLVATSPTKRTVKLVWKPSTDNVGVAGYYVYQDGVRIATTTATSYTVSGLTSRRTYSYVVKAFDKASLLSAPSNTASVVVR
jgi:chitodextrinase